jgi:hypothetical protein
MSERHDVYPFSVLPSFFRLFPSLVVLICVQHFTWFLFAAEQQSKARASILVKKALFKMMMNISCSGANGFIQQQR